jgi:acyl-coenzyme A synthetase/AMP-(fatty) acid ligase
MRTRLSEPLTLAALMNAGAGRGRAIATRRWRLGLDKLDGASSLGASLFALEGRSVVVAVGDMAKAAAALIDLDGWARRIVLCPPGYDLGGLDGLARATAADALVYDGDLARPPADLAVVAPCRLPLEPLAFPGEKQRRRRFATEWVMPTSGTSGPPKMVVHSLATLTGAIGPAPTQRWATFYDIRRYGGLQIFLRALAGAESLTLSDPDEGVDAFLVRLGEAGAKHISGTPSHWRKVLMSGQARRIDPETVRLSGEIADDAVLSALGALYPRARLQHAYASTEAGVAFAVEDGRAGFPASLIETDGAVAMKIVDGSLRIRSNRTALRYIGPGAPALHDAQGFVDTGDIVERRGDRYVFAGRRGGIINVGGAKVHPEEVEAAINAHEAVRASRVFARKNPITGALVAAEVVVREGVNADADLIRSILSGCRARLAAYKAPSFLRFVSELPMTEGGKLARHG